MKSKTVLVTSLAAATFGLVSLVDTAGVLPFSVQTVQADTQTINPSAKYYILVPNDSEVFKGWKGTANRPIIWATKTTPELSYFEESDRNYIALENKSGANYIEWKGTVDEFKEAVKKLTGKTTAATTPKTSNQSTAATTPKTSSQSTTTTTSKTSGQSTPNQRDGWSGLSYYQNGSKVISKWIFDKNYNSYFYLDASGNFVQNSWVGNYYLKSGGYMAKSEWIFDKNYGAYYYLTSEGSYSYSTWVGDYYVKSNGKMATKEWIFDKNYDSYYYLTSEGSYARNTWVGDYYLKSNGKMAVSERTPDGYQVDGSGKWISSEGTHTASSSQATSLGISLYHVNDAMTYIDIALPSTPSSSYQVAYDFALVDVNTGSVSTQTQFTVTYNPSLRAFQTRHFFSATPDGSYRFVIKGKGQDGKVYDGQSVVFRVKNHRFVGQMSVRF